MTDDELQAIRARAEDVPFWPSETDRRALLAEVDRLRAENAGLGRWVGHWRALAEAAASSGAKLTTEAEALTAENARLRGRLGEIAGLTQSQMAARIAREALYRSVGA